MAKKLLCITLLALVCQLPTNAGFELEMGIGPVDIGLTTGAEGYYTYDHRINEDEENHRNEYDYYLPSSAFKDIEEEKDSALQGTN